MPAANPAAAVRLPARLDLNAAAPLAEQLCALRRRNVVIDASQVERLGGLCLQVLLSARAVWTADGAVFEVSDPSSAFREDLVLFGAHELAGEGAFR